MVHEGLIQNEEAETIALVKSLVEHYTRRENTIILVTIPMSGTCIEL
jgi:vacuolar protein sorting-associated protein 1